METLPREMVEKISTKLSPEDLASCCAVSTRWREIFNRDFVWKPRCDPALEEHLSSTPSIVEPKFVTPGGKASSLFAISRWRLAFLRAKHLSNNWKNNNYKRGSFFEHECCNIHRKSLTDTHLFIVQNTHIEIWDITIEPAVLVIKTDPSVTDIKGWIDFVVTEGNNFAVKRADSVKRFFADVSNRCITLKQEISLDSKDNDIKENMNYCRRDKFTKFDCIKEKMFIHVQISTLQLDIYDFETGEKKREDYSLAILHDEGESKFIDMKTFPTSDYLVVVVAARVDPNYRFYYLFYIYDSKKLCFLPDPFKCIGFGENAGERYESIYFEVYCHYIAILENPLFHTSIKIYDCKTREVLGRVPQGLGFYCSDGKDCYYVVRELQQGVNYVLKMFSLSCKTWTVTLAMPFPFSSFPNSTYIIIKDSRWIIARSRETGTYILSENVWLSCDIFLHGSSLINRAMTKVISGYIYHYW